MLKTHCSYHRPRPRHHVSHFLNLLPVAQRVGDRRALGDAADAALSDSDALFDYFSGAFLREGVNDIDLGFLDLEGNL